MVRMLRPSRPIIRPLHFVIGQRHHRNRRFRHMVGGTALDGQGDNLPCGFFRFLPRICCSKFPHFDRFFMGQFILQAAQEVFFCLVYGKTADPFQLFKLLLFDPVRALGQTVVSPCGFSSQWLLLFAPTLSSLRSRFSSFCWMRRSWRCTSRRRSAISRSASLRIRCTSSRPSRIASFFLVFRCFDRIAHNAFGFLFSRANGGFLPAFYGVVYPRKCPKAPKITAARTATRTPSQIGISFMRILDLLHCVKNTRPQGKAPVSLPRFLKKNVRLLYQ